MLSGVANNLNQISGISYVKGEVSGLGAIRQMRNLIAELLETQKADSLIPCITSRGIEYGEDALQLLCVI